MCVKFEIVAGGEERLCSPFSVISYQEKIKARDRASALSFDCER